VLAAEGGDEAAGAGAVEAPAVVGALDLAQVNLALGEGDVAVGAAVEDGGGAPALVAEEGEGLALEQEGEGAIAELLAASDDEPLVRELDDGDVAAARGGVGGGGVAHEGGIAPRPAAAHNGEPGAIVGAG
jgi:hypothetical protein